MPLDVGIAECMDDARRAAGLLTIGETMALAERGNVIFDPFSVLISRYAEIGEGNLLYPCVTLSCTAGAFLKVGNRNVFHTGTLIAAEMGAVTIGEENQFGEGGFTAKANRPGASIIVGNGGRYVSGASVFGETELGSGSQILGAIAVDGCVLAAGAPYSSPDPDLRAAVLKGTGSARDLTVDVGKVIAGSGTFRQDDVKPQSFFHPKRA